MSINRKYASFILILAISLTLVLVGCTGTKTEPTKINYPEGTITIISPTSAGGGYDLATRVIAKYLPRHLPNEVAVQVVNQPGAGQMVGVHALYAAKPDGYTLGAFNGTGAMLSQFTRPEETKFDSSKFEYLGMWQYDTTVFGLINGLEFKTWDEFVARSKEKPILFGTGGRGTSQHNDPMIIDYYTDLSFEYIHYDGSANVEPGMARKEVEATSGQFSVSDKLQRNGIGYPFCVFSEKRLPMAPNVPTVLELGMPKEQLDKLNSCAFMGATRLLAAPPGTDPQIVAILRKAIWDTFMDPDYIADITKIGGENNVVKGEELAELIQEKLEAAKNDPELLAIMKEGMIEK